LHCGGCGIYFSMVSKYKVTISKSLWKIWWKLCGIILLLANEGCVIVRFLLTQCVCCKKSHRVARGWKIYKWGTHQGGFGG